MGTCTYKPDGKWDQQTNQMIELFAQRGHPVFRGTSALHRGTLQRKSGRNTIHFTADSGNIELMLRTIHSANQLCVYGAVSSWCIDLAEKMQGQASTAVDRSISEDMNSYHHSWIGKKLVPWYETSQRQKESRETACEFTCNDSK